MERASPVDGLDPAEILGNLIKFGDSDDPALGRGVIAENGQDHRAPRAHSKLVIESLRRRGLLGTLGRERLRRGDVLGEVFAFGWVILGFQVGPVRLLKLGDLPWQPEPTHDRVVEDDDAPVHPENELVRSADPVEVGERGLRAAALLHITPARGGPCPVGAVAQLDGPGGNARALRGAHRDLLALTCVTPLDRHGEERTRG